MCQNIILDIARIGMLDLHWKNFPASSQLTSGKDAFSKWQFQPTSISVLEVLTLNVLTSPQSDIIMLGCHRAT